MWSSWLKSVTSLTCCCRRSLRRRRWDACSSSPVFVHASRLSGVSRLSSGFRIPVLCCCRSGTSSGYVCSRLAVVRRIATSGFRIPVLCCCWSGTSSGSGGSSPFRQSWWWPLSGRCERCGCRCIDDILACADACVFVCVCVCVCTRALRIV